MTNRKRQCTDRARRALVAYGAYSPDELDSAISDLASDLMHLAEINELNFANLLASAESNYQDERLDYEAMPELPTYRVDPE